jgi:bacillopeptidase F
VHVTLDTVSPTLSLTSPLSGVLVNTTSIRVLGSIEAGALLSINDIEVTGANGDFDERVGLTEGANTIAVGATDAAGNAAAVQIIVYRDTIAPDLTTDLPATPKTTESPVITVTGRAVGAVSLRVNGDVVALDAGGKFTVVVPLELGVNSLTFVATDAAGNSQTVLGVVYRAAPLEAPGGLFGLGDASYALLPLALIIGAVAAYLVVRVRRRAGP